MFLRSIIISVLFFFSGINNTSTEEIPVDREFNVTIPGNQREKFDLDLKKLNESSLQRDFEIRAIDPFQREELNKLRLQTAEGREIYFRVAAPFADKVFIVGTTEADQSLIISRVDDVGGSIRITFAARDRQGNFVKVPEAGQVFLFDEKGKEICLNIKPIETSSVEIHIGLAMDVSGSMHPFSSELNKSLQKFLSYLPEKAYCTIVEFESDHKILAGGVGNKALCHNLKNITLRTPGGRTRLFPALKELYDIVNAKHDTLKLILIVSDGVSDSYGKEEAKTAKKEVATFVNWLGNYDKNYALSEFADGELFGVASGSGSMLNRFFQKAGSVVNNQFVATPCKV